MRYLIAVACPPAALAMFGRPLQAFGSSAVLVVAALTWAWGVGIILVALTILWATRVACESYANDEVVLFLRNFRGRAPIRH